MNRLIVPGLVCIPIYACIAHRGERTLERQSRILREERSAGEGEEEGERRGKGGKGGKEGGRLRFDQFGVRASQLRLPDYRDSEEDEEEEGGR